MAVVTITKGRTNGFTKAFCAKCGEETWHYHGWCCPCPPPPPRPMDPPVEKEPERLSPIRMSREVGRRVKHVCGHPHFWPAGPMCEGCLDALKGSECPACVGYVYPRPVCACGSTYRFDEGIEGVEVTTPCEYCTLQTPVWGLGEAYMGRLMKVKRKVRLPNGQEEDEVRTIPRIKRLKVCGECARIYGMFKALTPAGRTAFLPWRG